MNLFAGPLNDILKGKRKFKLVEQEKEEEEESFQLLKKKLCEHNFEYEIKLHTDASRDRYGAIVLQRYDVDGKLHPVHYMRRKTTDCKKN